MEKNDLGIMLYGDEDNMDLSFMTADPFLNPEPKEPTENKQADD